MFEQTWEVVTLLVAIVRKRVWLVRHPAARRRLARSGLASWWPVLVGEDGRKVLCLYLAPGGEWSLELCSEERDWEDEGRMSFGLKEWRRSTAVWNEE